MRGDLCLGALEVDAMTHDGKIKEVSLRYWMSSCLRGHTRLLSLGHKSQVSSSQVMSSQVRSSRVRSSRVRSGQVRSGKDEEEVVDGRSVDRSIG
mgnify:CR=1 FL=1